MKHEFEPDMRTTAPILCLPKPAPLTRVKVAPLALRPMLSVVVPSFNQGRFIRATIDSILSQDYRPLQIIVVDGGSRDETVDVLESYGNIPELEWQSEPDRGVVEAVNKGFARVRGDIVAIQSSDDCYLPGAVSAVVQAFQNDAKLGLLYGDTVKVDANGTEISRYQIGPFSLENLFLIKTWIPQPSAFFRREMLDVCGGWDEGIPYAPDTDLWIRMAFRTKVTKLDQYLSQRRVHDEQRDTQEGKIVRDYCKMIDQSSDVRQAPAEIRQAALSSKHMIRERYRAGASDWCVAWHLIQGAIACPKTWQARRVIHYLFLPIRRGLSWIKQGIRKRIGAQGDSVSSALQN